jgi:hypothetical protein
LSETSGPVTTIGFSAAIAPAGSKAKIKEAMIEDLKAVMTISLYLVDRPTRAR